MNLQTFNELTYLTFAKSVEKMFNIRFSVFIFHFNGFNQAVQWLGQPAAAPNVPGSNPGWGMDVKNVRIGPHQWLRCSAL